MISIIEQPRGTARLYAVELNWFFFKNFRFSRHSLILSRNNGQYIFCVFRVPKLSSDSDSGHGEGGDKRHLARNLNVPLTNSRKSQQQQRRQLRQSNNKNRGGNNSRSERASTWVKHNKSTRARKLSKSKPSRELTESDSGQEMHFSFEGIDLFIFLRLIILQIFKPRPH